MWAVAKVINPRQNVDAIFPETRAGTARAWRQISRLGTGEVRRYGLGNLAASTVDQLAAIMGNPVRRIQHRPALISGFLAQTGPTLEAPVSSDPGPFQPL